MDIKIEKDLEVKNLSELLPHYAAFTSFVVLKSFYMIQILLANHVTCLPVFVACPNTMGHMIACDVKNSTIIYNKDRFYSNSLRYDIC